MKTMRCLSDDHTIAAFSNLVVVISRVVALLVMQSLYRRSQGGPKGTCPPQIIRKYSHFVL